MSVKIKFLVSVATAQQSFQGDCTYSMPAAKAEEWVRDGIGVYVDPNGEHAYRASANDWRGTVRPGDLFQWQVKIKLSRFVGPFIRQKNWPPGDAPLDRRRSRSQYLNEVGGFNDEVGRPQAVALDYLVKNEAKIFAKLLSAVAKYARTFRTNWEIIVGARVADRIVPREMTAKQVVERIQLSTIEVSAKARGGIAYLKIGGNCSWDWEHGVDVVFHRDRVVDVCQQGTGWVDRHARRVEKVQEQKTAEKKRGKSHK